MSTSKKGPLSPQVQLWFEGLKASIYSDWLCSLDDAELEAYLQAKYEAMSPQERAEEDAAVERLQISLMKLLEEYSKRAD